MRHSTGIQINTLLSRNSDTLVKLPDQAEIKTPVWVVAELQAQAMEHSPRFEQHHKMLGAAKTRIEIAEKDFYPDLTLGAGYAVRQNTPSGESRSDFASVKLSINLPIYAEQNRPRQSINAIVSCCRSSTPCRTSTIKSMVKLQPIPPNTCTQNSD